MTLQYRIAPEGQVRDVDEGKRQVLVSFPWEVIDSYNTDFSRGAFDDHLRQALPIMVWQHVRSEPIGRAKEWQKTHAANEFVAGFSDFDAVPRARQAFTQIRDRELTDFSYGFDRAKSTPHPSVRGAVRFSVARMAEISPVSVGSIPGAVAVGIRAEAEVANVRGLLDMGAIDEDGANEMLRAAGLDPLPRQRVEVATDPLGDAIRAELAKAGQRGLTITVGDDGTVTTSGDAPSAGDTGDAGGNTGSEDDVAELASAIDAACDAADGLLDGLDTTGLPAEVQQALALYSAASVAADELLDTLGVPDPDEPNEDDRAAKAPYGDVEYADPGYQDDKQKRYPLDTEEHVRAAWSYINQKDNAAKYSAEDLAKVKAKITAAAKKFGIETADTGGRSAQDLDVQMMLARQALRR